MNEEINKDDKNMLLKSISDIHFDFDSDEDRFDDIDHEFGTLYSDNE